MSDLISRRAAIDATWFEPSYTDPLNVLTEVRDRLKALPSAHPEPRWILWEKLERYAEFFCADVPYTEFVREAKQFCLDAERSEE